MANITAKLLIPVESGSGHVLWETMLQNDVGLQVRLGKWADKTIQVIGTFNGALVVPEGSPDGTTWGALNDPQGTTISITDNVPVLIAENPIFIRIADVNGGVTTDLDIYLSFARK